MSDAPTTPPAARRLGPRSLSGRLVLGVVSLVVVLVLATGAGTYFALRSFLFQRLDQQLRSTANTATLNELFFPTQPFEPSVQAPQHVWAVALTTDGAVLADPQSAGVKALRLTTAARLGLVAAAHDGPRTVSTSDGLDMRVVATSVRIRNQQTQVSIPAVAVVGLSTHEVRTTLGRLVALELAIGASAVLLAFLATTYGVRFSLRRLYRVTTTAQEVAAELSPEGRGLDRRVPFSDDGTEVGQLAGSMNTLLAAVETQFAARLESEQRMRQFLADASHELRTPLTSIRGYAELARMREDGNAGDDLGRIESEGTRMSRLVDDLLVLARSDQQDAPPERHLIDVGEVLDEVVTTARAAFPERSIALDTSSGLAVVGDPDQILRVVRNLVANAAHHTRSDGPISVSAGEDGEDVVVRIVDAGPGLPPEEAVHVFERFWRADRARTRARGGSGLGMAIVASLVRAHGGTVRFDSSVERGSTVTVRLPVASA